MLHAIELVCTHPTQLKFSYATQNILVIQAARPDKQHMVVHKKLGYFQN